MKKRCIMFLSLIVCALIAHAQSDDRPVIGVAHFSSEVQSPFINAVSEKVVQIVTNTHRFIVVDRTSYDKVQQELELQKSEAFMDSKNLARQDVAIAAQYMIIGHLIKLNIYTLKNTYGEISGYKSSVAFTLKVNDVETGMVTEAETFQSDVSPIAASKEQAVNQALASLEKPLNTYISKTFAVTTKIVRILETKKESAKLVLINGGNSYGLQEGDKLIVERIEELDGKPYPSTIGEIKVEKLSGNDFAECKVLKGGDSIYMGFSNHDNIHCKLIVK